MAASMVRQHSGRHFRSGRFRGRHGSGEDNLQLDFTKDPAENVKEILSYVIKQHAFSKAKKLGYLNAFAKLLKRSTKDTSFGFTLLQILRCLRVNLLHGAKEVRAATLRVLKHVVVSEEALNAFLDLHIDYFVVRSLDLSLDNEVERIHAQRLVRRIAQVTPQRLPKSLVYPLVAIGSDGAAERDRMVRVALATICELAYSNPDLVAHCGGISMLLRKVLDCHQYPRINESLVCTILHLINHPRTRHFVHFNTDLEQLLAPFTDCHFSYHAEKPDQSNEDRESRFAASKMAVVTVMRSWPGIIRFCRTDGTGLQSLVGIMYLPFMDVRQALLEVLFDLFHLRIPDWTADFTAALLSTDPSAMRDDWRLTDGFVAEEGKSILPHMAKIRPNLVDNHLALLLAAWIGAGILDALVEVIITTEEELFVRSVILLGELLHMANQLMPPECSNHSHYLPSLMALATSFNIPNRERHQASLAVSYLDRIHHLKKRGPIPCSLYLDQVVRNSASYKERPTALNLRRDKLLDLRKHISTEDLANQTIRDCQVLSTKDNSVWDWDLIAFLLRWPDDKLRRLEDQSHVRFIRRLVFFFKPTNHLFSRMEAESDLEHKFAIAGSLLMDFLIRCDQEEALKLLVDWLTDIGLCLSEVSLQRMAPESVLSPGNLLNTLSHYYFLFLGRLSLTGRGDRYLEKTGIFQHLLDTVSSATQDSYIKLIVTSLYYGRAGNSRAVLIKALCAATESGRLYSTKFMRVLLRAKAYNFNTWGIEMLVAQLYDQSRAVAMTALSVLDEACEVQVHLQSLIQLKPSFLHLGEKGVMILCRYMSVPSGFKFLTDANYTSNELKKWHAGFNTKYVRIVEELLNEALTTYEKTYEGSYTRHSNRKRGRKDVYVPTHLYGQLVQHKDGFQLLRQQEYVSEYFQCIRCLELKSNEDMLRMKTALWAVGHISTSSWGMSWLDEEKIVPEVIRLAEECGVFSIRGTAFFVLGLMSSTREGAEVLTQFGWESRWNTRAERWPVVEDRAMLLEDSMDESQFEVSFSPSSAKFEMGSPISNLDFIAEEHFQLASPPRGGSDVSRNGCDTQEKNMDTESGIHIPFVHQSNRSNSPELRHSGFRAKSRTLPLEAHSYKRFQTLPARSQTIRSISLTNVAKEKTGSAEFIADKKPVIEKRHSLRWDVSPSGKGFAFSADDKRVNTVPKKEEVKQHEEQTEKTDLAGETTPADSSVVDSPLPQLNSAESDVVISNKPIVIEIPVSVIQNNDKEQNQQISISVTDSEVQRCEDLQTDGDIRVESFSQNGADSISFSMHSPPQEELSESRSKALDNRNSSAKRPVTLKDERSSSSESSRTSKSRTDSFNTDSTTSGIGSLDSSHHGVMEMPSLSPIASSNSLEHVDVTLRTHENKESRDIVHHSIALRRLSNLSRIPSFRRQSSPSVGLLPSSKFFDFSENAINYTTARDAIGYATLRSLMKHRTISSDLESDYGLNRLYDSESVSSMSRRPSMDSTSTEAFRPSSGLTRNLSGVTLSDYDSPSVMVASPKMTIYQHRAHTGESEFIGLALPVDVNMLFEVHEGEDRRSVLGNVISRQASFIDGPEIRLERADSGLEDWKEAHLSRARGGSHSRQSSVSRDGPREVAALAPISMEHNKSVCIQCHQLHEAVDISVQVTDCGEDASKGEKGEVPSTNFLVVKTGNRSRSSSLNEQTTEASGGSVTSTTSDSSTRKLSAETPVGRTLLRKEIIRYVINLSSSVGVKGAEQGLLSLKQKFPKAFQDLCFYSEISYLLGTCSFRMTARRFIQELFEDMDMSKLFEEAIEIVGEEANGDKMKVDKSLAEDFDDFSENFA